MMTTSIKNPYIIALTDTGLALARRLQLFIDESEVWFKPKPFANTVQQVFVAGHPLIFICATGIVVRTLAPVLANKFDDPPVLVLDEQGGFVIPLLSGHEGGANQWAKEISEKISAQLVLTTAKNYLRPVYSVGIGCERYCPVEMIESLLQHCLQLAKLSINDISSINSIDIKLDELGIIECANFHGKPFHTYSVAELTTVEGLLQTPSDYVFNTVGVYGVAESAALYSAKIVAQSAPELILAKQKNTKATCAIARSYSL
ncbi:MAG: cobalt-precorrin 5A hydrolase [Candidatus Endobugula sp.]|jgi:cobalt-precorrin 5A hydrolase